MSPPPPCIAWPTIRDRLLLFCSKGVPCRRKQPRHTVPSLPLADNIPGADERAEHGLHGLDVHRAAAPAPLRACALAQEGGGLVGDGQICRLLAGESRDDTPTRVRKPNLRSFVPVVVKVVAEALTSKWCDFLIASPPSSSGLILSERDDLLGGRPSPPTRTIVFVSQPRYWKCSLESYLADTAAVHPLGLRCGRPARTGTCQP